SAGDVNGDGFDEILIGADKNDNWAGKTYLIFGRSNGWSMDTNLSSVDSSFIGEDMDDQSGRSVSSAGDVNGDGFDDILIGAYTDEEGGSGAGQTYLIPGKGYPEPLEIYDIKVMNDVGEEITVADKGETVHVELSGLDSNITHIDRANVNISFRKSEPSRLLISLLETGMNSGIYKGSFLIPSRSTYLENVTFSPYIDPTKEAIVQINPPIQLRPVDIFSEIPEDSWVNTTFWNFGYNEITTWNFETNADWIRFDPLSHTITGTPDNSHVGEWWMTINITDGIGHFDERNCSFTVINTNPHILSANLLSIKQDQYYFVDYSSDDEGLGNTQWSISPENIVWLDLDTATGVLDGIPTNDDVGSYVINVSIDDGNGGVNWSIFTLNVIDVNDPPLITTEPITSVLQGVNYNIQFICQDEDDIDDLKWAMKTDAGFLELNDQTGVLSGTPDNGDVGRYFVDISVEDTSGERDWLNYTLEVIDVNDPPTWSSVPLDPQIDQGNEYAFTVEALDVDVGDTVYYSISSQPSSDITIDENSGEINWIGSLGGLTQNPNYILNVEISATDGKEIITHEFTIMVIPNPNPTSIIIRPEDGSRITSEGILLEWEGEDDGEEPLKYDIYLGQSQTAISILDRNVLWIENIADTSIHTGVIEQGKTYYWTVIPRDIFSSGICTNDLFSFTVNTPPSIQELIVPEAKIGEEFRLDLMGSDQNSDGLEFTLEEGPTGMELFNGMITWMPTEGQAGKHAVNVSLSDGIESIYKEFEVEVTEKEIITEPGDKGSPIVPIIIVIVVILILVGAGIGVFLYLKNKGEPEPDDESVDSSYPRGNIHSDEEEKPEEETPNEDIGLTER
ncbi:MAG: FG-GAP repeat protein, partial [Thermoplasmata archaeon]|nr:FG-GAP repeat protein [Thermoplasmata archaeon]